MQQLSGDRIFFIQASDVAAQAGEDTTELMRSVQKRLDMAAQKGVIHKNEAARRKSRLIARANAAAS